MPVINQILARLNKSAHVPPELRVTRSFACAFAFVVLALWLSLSMGFNQVDAQEPRPNIPNLSLVPLVMLSVGVDDIANPVSSPTGAARPTPEFFVPRNVSKEFLVATSGGSGTVGFSSSVPPGVPASDFQWEQVSVPAGNATGRLRYNGCTSCPASFTIEITAASNNVVHTSVILKLTASTGKPVMNSISSISDDTLQPLFEIRFAQSTFDATDSQVVATYASGLKYRLVPEATSQFAQGRLQVKIPRLEINRNVKISLANPYGSSSSSSITLPQQGFENAPFVQVNSSNVFPDALSVFGNPNFSVKHSNVSLLADTGSDDIAIQPLATASVCNQQGFIYLGAKVSWLDANDHPTNAPGTVTITSQPQSNALLRSPAKIRVNWTLNAGTNRDVWYQVVVNGVTVVGVCHDRVIH